MADKPGSGGGVQQGVGGTNPKGFPAPDRSGFSYLGVTPQSTSKLMDGLDGIVTSLQAANQESRKIYKEMHASAEMTARTMGSVLDRAEQLLMMVSKSNGQGIAALATTGAGFDTGGSVAGLSGSGIPTAPSREGRGEGGVTAGVGGSQGRPTQSLIPGSFQDGKAMHLGDLRSGVAERVGHGIRDWGTGMKQVYRTADGRFASRYVPKGSPKYRDAEVEMAPGWRATGVNAIQAGVQTVADGGTFMQGFGGVIPAAAKAAGVAGAIYGGVNWGLNFAEDQRRKNAEFQSILGGANTEGFGERWDQNKFRWSMRGTMSGSEAEAIYKGAAENFGTNKALRGTYQDAAITMARQAGMGVQSEILPMLNMAADTGNTHLSELADTIVKLGRSARVAGISAKEARNYFTQSFSALSPTMSDGSLIQSAAIQASTKVSYGKDYEVDTSSRNTDTGMRRAAAALGITLQDYIAATNYGGSVMIQGEMRSGAEVKAMGNDALMRQGINAMDPKGEIRRFGNAYIRRRGWDKPGNAPNDREFKQLALAISNRFKGLDPKMIQSVLAEGGLANTSEADALGVLTHQMFNQGVSEVSQLNKTKVSDEIPDFMTPAELEKKYLADIKSGKGKFSPTGAPAVDPAALKWARKTLGNPLLPESLDPRANGKAGLSNALAMDAYAGRSVNPVGFKMFKNYDQLGAGSRLLVHTKEGMRSAELGEAMAMYGDQIRNRPDLVRIQGGPNDGALLSDVLNVKGNGKSISKMESYNKDPSGWTSSVGKGAAQARDAEGGGGGKVVISLTEEARQWFKTQPSGNVRNATSRPPAASQAGPSTQPSGN